MKITRLLYIYISYSWRRYFIFYDQLSKASNKIDSQFYMEQLLKPENSLRITGFEPVPFDCKQEALGRDIFSNSIWLIRLWLRWHIEVRFSGHISNVNYFITNCDLSPAFEYFPQDLPKLLNCSVRKNGFEYRGAQTIFQISIIVS